MTSELVYNEYFLPKKLSVRHENMSGSHKTMFGDLDCIMKPVEHMFHKVIRVL